MRSTAPSLLVLLTFVAGAPLSSAEPSAPKDPLNLRVSVRVKNAPLAVFLETISAQSGVNFLISDDVPPRNVTAFLQDVTVREALEVLAIDGLTYYRLGADGRYRIDTASGP